MGFHRRFLYTRTVNVSDCFNECPGICFEDVCITSPLPPSLSDKFHRPSHHISNLFIAVGCLVAAAFFFLLTCYSIFSRQRRRRPSTSAVTGTVAGEGGHHLWVMKTIGLDEATIESIAVYEYQTGDGLLGAADCAVCLGEFSDGEHVRLLPKCCHAFHVACIDVWLRGHVNCPLCRAFVVAPPAGPSPPPPPMEGDSGPFDASEGDQGSSRVEREDVVINPSPAFSSLLQQVNSDSREGGLQPVRRAVSMLLLPQGDVTLQRMEPGESSNVEDKEPDGMVESSSMNRGKREYASNEAEKSTSGSARGFFFHKYRRSRSLILHG